MRRLFRARYSYAAAVIAALLIAPGAALAQLDSPSTGGLSIVFSPRSPAPGDLVSLTLESNRYDLAHDTITWQINGKTTLSDIGATRTSVTAGAAGSATTISASITGDDGAASVTATLVPTTVDIIWEGNSYAPPFYGGRTLPSPGGTIEVEALPVVREHGAIVPADKLVYTWTVNGAVQSDISGRGKNTATIDAPIFSDSAIVEVDVETQDGLAGAAGSVTIPAADPFLRLYEDHPLYGVLYDHALDPTTIVDEPELSFAAVPYFADRGAATLADAFNWKVNRASVEPATDTPDEITINGGKAGGTALINLSYSDMVNHLYAPSGAWVITFRAGGTSINPFSGQ